MSNSERVLLVEDDELVRQYLAEQLTDLGYEVTTAANGDKALKTLQDCEAKFHLLLTDIVMPGTLGGWDLGERAQTINPDLKVLYMSGYGENASVESGRARRNIDLLSKPFGRDTLDKKVRSVLDR